MLNKLMTKKIDTAIPVRDAVIDRAEELLAEAATETDLDRLDHLATAAFNLAEAVVMLDKATGDHNPDRLAITIDRADANGLADEMALRLIETLGQYEAQNAEANEDPVDEFDLPDLSLDAEDEDDDFEEELDILALAQRIEGLEGVVNS